MTATGYLDACGFIPTAGGATDFVVSAAITGYQTPASAGAVNATVYSYRAESADKTQWEEGFGSYTVASTTLARTTVTASSTGAKVSFSAAPNVFITALSADLQNAGLLNSGMVGTARLGSGTANSTNFLRGDSTWSAPTISVGYESSGQTITTGSTTTLAHGLGVRPKVVQVFLKCTVANLNYSVGDIVVYWSGYSANNRGIDVQADATNIYIRVGTGGIDLLDKSLYTANLITAADWNIIVGAYA